MDYLNLFWLAKVFNLISQSMQNLLIQIFSFKLWIFSSDQRRYWGYSLAHCPFCFYLFPMKLHGLCAWKGLQMRVITIFFSSCTLFLIIHEEFDELFIFLSKICKKYTEFSCKWKIQKKLRRRLNYMGLLRLRNQLLVFLLVLHAPHAFKDLEVILHVILMLHQEAAI